MEEISSLLQHSFGRFVVQAVLEHGSASHRHIIADRLAMDLVAPCLAKLRDHHQSRFLGRGCDEALFSEKKKGVFSEKGGNAVNQGFGKDFYRKGNSVKRFGPFTEPPDSEN